MLQHDQEFARRTAPGPLEMDHDIQLTYDISFVEPRIVEAEPVLPFLAQSAQLVEAIVNQFVPFL
jgi:hypothetical protein